MKQKFKHVNFKPASLELLDAINEIIEEYQAQGLRMTLRQLYYQLVTRNTIANQERAYKNLGKLLSEGRLTGHVDWNAIEDRLRKPHKVTEWKNPRQIMEAVVAGYKMDRWALQETYIELWVEKDALAGVLEPIADQYHVVLMVNRGYSSQSAMKESAERFRAQYLKGKHQVKILYIGDMDPSGEDMVRDVEERIYTLSQEVPVQVVKLAITEAQVAQFTPPPNPTKMTDSRAAAYIEKFGMDSYEADALPPDILAGVARGAIEAEIDFQAWANVVDEEDAHKELLRQASEWVMDQLPDEEEPDWSMLDPDGDEDEMTEPMRREAARLRAELDEDPDDDEDDDDMPEEDDTQAEDLDDFDYNQDPGGP